MTNLTTNTPRTFRGVRTSVTITLGATVLVGAAVELSSGTGQNLTGAGTTFVGFALQQGVSGDRVEVADDGRVLLTVAKATNWAASDVGATVYGTDGNAFTLTSAGGQAIGKVEEIVSGTGTTSASAWVRFQGIAQRSI